MQIGWRMAVMEMKALIFCLVRSVEFGVAPTTKDVKQQSQYVLLLFHGRRHLTILQYRHTAIHQPRRRLHQELPPIDDQGSALKPCLSTSNTS